MEYLLIFISAIFVNNIILSQFLGICPFLGVSQKIDTSLGMSAAVAFVMTLATIVTWLIQKFVLDAFDLQYLQTIVFILVIAALVQMVEIVLKKVSPALYQALGIFLPSDHNKLCCAWCCNSCHPKRLLPATECCLCFLNSYRLWIGSDSLCRSS